MDLIAQLEAAGLKVVSGNLRLQAALSAGVAVEATDGLGNNFRITAQGAQVSVEKLERPSSQGQAPVLVKIHPLAPHATETSQAPVERDYDPAEPRWISTSDFEAAMVRPEVGTHFTEPMLGRAADGEEIPFVTATSSASGISWSKNVVEVLVEPRNRSRGWLARPLW